MIETRSPVLHRQHHAILAQVLFSASWPLLSEIRQAECELQRRFRLRPRKLGRRGSCQSPLKPREDFGTMHHDTLHDRSGKIRPPAASDERAACPLTLDDLAHLADSSDQFARETMDRLRHHVRSQPLFAPELAYFEALARDAGLSERHDRRRASLQCNDELDRLLAADSWQHPADVLDPEGIVGIGYRELIHIAEARARRAAEPDALHAVRDKLKRARDADQAKTDCVDTFIAALLTHDPEGAETLLRRAARVYRFHREQRQAEEERTP